MRGSKKRGLFRRRLAGFLSACLVITNLQGLTFAYGAEEETVWEKAGLIQLDMSAMQAAVQEAAESGVLITAPEMAASAANAWELPFTDPAYELSPGNIEALLTEGTELPADTSLRIFLEPMEETEEHNGENSSYVITGDEKLIFFIENESNEAQAYQIRFGQQVTSLIVAESRKTLRKELNGEDMEEGFAGGAEAPTKESTEESSQAETEESTGESSQAETEESTGESSQAETKESTGESSQAETEESSQTETEESTEESSQAETEESAEESSQAETEESTEESSQAETEESAEESSQTETEESAEESSQTETEESAEESSQTETEESTGESSQAETEETAAESTEAAVEEAYDVPQERQAAPENESPAAVLWRTAVNFLTGSITARAAETATPPEAVETEPETEETPETQDTADSQSGSGSSGSSGSAGGSGAQEDRVLPVATDGNASQKPAKKPEKEKVFIEADGLDGLTMLDIDAVNVLVDGGLKRAGGGMARMMAVFADRIGGERSVAMFALPLNALLAPAAAGDSSFQMTLYDYGCETAGGSSKRINQYLGNNENHILFGGGTHPWNAFSMGEEGNKKM